MNNVMDDVVFMVERWRRYDRVMPSLGISDYR